MAKDSKWFDNYNSRDCVGIDQDKLVQKKWMLCNCMTNYVTFINAS